MNSNSHFRVNQKIVRDLKLERISFEGLKLYLAVSYFLSVGCRREAVISWRSIERASGLNVEEIIKAQDELESANLILCETIRRGARYRTSWGETQPLNQTAVL